MIKIDNELIYKRLCFKNSPNILKLSSMTKNYNRSETQTTEEMINLLKQGEIFLKYGETGTPHYRLVQLSKNEDKFTWRTVSSCSFSFSFHHIETIDV